jgi:hypothetical protein
VNYAFVGSTVATDNYDCPAQVPSSTMKIPKSVLDRYFSIFESTIELADALIKEKRHAQEILILLCARLDALASDAASGEVHNSEAFTRFVTCYGGHRKLFESVSVGDLYYDLTYLELRNSINSHHGVRCDWVETNSVLPHHENYHPII